MLNLLETKRRGTGELGDYLRLRSHRQGARDVGQRKEAVENRGISNALVIGQDGSDGEPSIVVEDGNNGLVWRVLFGLLHKVKVGVEDVVSLAQGVAGEATPQLGTPDSL